MQDRLADLVLQILPRRLQRETELARQAAEYLHIIGAGRVGLGPGHDRALLDRQLVIGDDQVFVEDQLFAQTVTGRARPLRRVEREQSRLDLGNGEAADRTGELLGEDDAAVGRVVAQHGGLGRGGLDWIGGVDIGQTIRQLQRGLETVGQTRRDILAHHQTVDHHLDVMLELLVERRRLVDLIKLAVDADAGEARLLPLGHFLAIFALAAAHDGGEQVQARALRERHHPVDHLADRLRRDRLAGSGRVRDADPRPEQAHIVVDFGDRRHGRARIAAGRLLLDRDGGRQPLDMVDVRLLHHLQELARIGRQRLDVTPLSLGIDGVERQRRLARSRQAGDHRQRVTGNVDIDILKIVLARAADGNLGQHEAGSTSVPGGRPEAR